MKKLIMLLSLLATFSAAQAASVNCRIEAQVAAGEYFAQKFPDENFYIRKNKLGMRAEDNVIHHFVDIVDKEDQQHIMRMLTVTVSPANNCKILDIN